MEKREFDAWIEELKVMMPETGAWLGSLPLTVRAAWFDEYFSQIDAGIAKVAITRILRDGGIKNYDRENLPNLVEKHVSQIEWDMRPAPTDPNDDKCGGCNGTGYISHPRPKMQPIVAACSCPMGDKRKEDWDERRRSNIYQLK